MTRWTLDDIRAKGLRVIESKPAREAWVEPKPNKYGAHKAYIDGYTFDSKREGAYYAELKLRVAAGEIRAIAVHPVFPLPGPRFPEIPRICEVELDFMYFDIKADRWRYIDVKGHDVPLSRLKRKFLEAFYPGLKVEIVK